MEIKIKILPNADGLALPSYATTDSAGLDLLAAIEGQLKIKPFERVLVPCGFQMALPGGYEAQVRPRSGLAIKNGVTVLNSPGTIDADYRGEVKVVLINLGEAEFVIERGMRIAQMIVAPVTKAKLLCVDVLDETVRGVGGFGSTGA